MVGPISAARLRSGKLHYPLGGHNCRQNNIMYRKYHVLLLESTMCSVQVEPSRNDSYAINAVSMSLLKFSKVLMHH